MYKPNIIMSDNQGFEDILYGAPSREISKYLSTKMSEVAGFITEKSKRFFNRSKEMFNEFSSEAARKRITDRMLINNSSLSNDVLSIIRVDDINNLCNVNRRYLMANPELYELKRKGRISGFDGAYEDVDKYNTNAYFKRDYIRARDGLVRISKDKDSLEYIYTISEGIDRLTLSEQNIISRNWKTATSLLKDDIDITSNDSTI